MATLRLIALIVIWVPMALAGTPPELIHSEGAVTYDPQSGKVTTGGDGQAILRLSDGSRIKVKANSELTLATDPAGTQIQLIRGGVLSSVQKQLQGKKFSLRTRTVIMGVRGTQFFASVTRQGDVWMCVNEGAVAIESAGKSVQVPAGQGVQVTTGSAPGEPRAFAWTKKINWNFDPTQGGTVDPIDPEKIYPDLRRVNYD